MPSVLPSQSKRDLERYGIMGPFEDADEYTGWRSVGGWLMSPEQYGLFEKQGLAGLAGQVLYPAWKDVPPPPLSMKGYGGRGLRDRVKVGGYYGSGFGFSMFGDKSLLYHYPKAQGMFPTIPNLPTTPDITLSAGYGGRSGYTGLASWAGRTIGMRGGTGYSSPQYTGSLLATGYSYPEGFWEGLNR